MNVQDLEKARERRGWSQQEAARRLGISQAYVSMLENGTRRVTHTLARKFMQAYGLAPTVLPPTRTFGFEDGTNAQTLAAQLAALGYPGFLYLRPHVSKKNPAEVLLTALSQGDLEARLVEALPWLLLEFWDLDLDWLVNQAKQLDLQNRLGFVVSMARQLAQRLQPQNEQRDRVLAEVESRLERSALAREDTLCQASLTPAERQWLLNSRSKEAERWNLLTNWQVDHFRYAA